MRSVLAVCLATALVLAAGACGGSDDDDSSAEGGTTTTQTTATTPDVGDFEGGTDPVTGEPQAQGTALLEDVEIGRNEGFDRIVFTFRDHVPGYRVEYQEPPLTEDGSGAVVELAGNSLVVIRMEPASGFDTSVPEGQQIYTGPRRLNGTERGTEVMTEAVRSGDFEAVLTWGVGSERTRAFPRRDAPGPAAPRRRLPARVISDACQVCPCASMLAVDAQGLTRAVQRRRRRGRRPTRAVQPPSSLDR